MNKTVLVGLIAVSFNAQAFLDFNSYGSDYKDNDWPVWTPMFWMEKVTDNNPFSDGRNSNYPYPYNNRPYNVGGSQFNMSQMPTPNQAFQAESQQIPRPVYRTPAAMSFSNPGNVAEPALNLPNPYPANYNFSEPKSPYGRGF
ncbi:hypothetical protein [Candidatus Thioglobus sp.]|jgi:hypothetical protein|uniref:hypothetical protein n=1 Tax=Candidatus Thioglobus sp. TaxID=2026721 RepID=UPI001D6A9718|nr:hypothetical protein [Candidatus Thioglobus sp.]MBT3277554.1 hypothetical protein [Candidatus Thioglobus sp.]MBT4000526.1 hypothetical protein [Candidatus Thioglobus sp.]MBT4181604.1 hypothetical protein [Candidatus Thioglobus sp.]MBT4422372.1 hypothetical protein [Candidatus Thioglobus sp.]MBT4747415.1 hypothetical protein [Candidatus Thioglobus sp.]